MLARGIGSRDNSKKIEKANKESQKGKKSKKGNSLEGGVKWVSGYCDQSGIRTNADLIVPAHG